MKIIDFTAAHIEAAAQIARKNYESELRHTATLPPVAVIPDLLPFVENGLGVAAFDGEDMLGFLGCVSPFPNVFGTTEATGVFSPLGANGAIGDHRSAVYARMYQAAGAKWAGAGAASHAICLYAHDREAQAQFFRYGFGMRTIDAIRKMTEIITPDGEGQTTAEWITDRKEYATAERISDCKEYAIAEQTPDGEESPVAKLIPDSEEYTVTELTPAQFRTIFPLDTRLRRHFRESPFFMVRPIITEAEFLEESESNRYFAAAKDGEPVAFFSVGGTAETFIGIHPDYIHTAGAYCLPEHRGQGLNRMLLNYAIKTLKTEGYTYLGVDFESINPAAYGFWRKYFDTYTCGLVRRIDEGALP